MADILPVLAPESDAVRWSILDIGEVVHPSEPYDEWSSADAVIDSPIGLELSLAELTAFAARRHQVIDGLFVGFTGPAPRRSDDDAAIIAGADIVVAVIDSSFWLVGGPESVGERVRTALGPVEDVRPDAQPLSVRPRDHGSDLDAGAQDRSPRWPERTHALPDGRRLRASYEGEPVGWVVYLVGQEDRSVSARDIHDALVDLLEPGRGGWPDWFIEAANDLAARDTPLGRRYACPCCGYLTLTEPPTGTYNICQVCFWEDDGVQFRSPHYEGGANKVSLNQARQNYRVHGVSEPHFRDKVRPPLPDERP